MECNRTITIMVNFARIFYFCWNVHFFCRSLKELHVFRFSTSLTIFISASRVLCNLRPFRLASLPHIRLHIVATWICLLIYLLLCFRPAGTFEVACFGGSIGVSMGEEEAEAED